MPPHSTESLLGPMMYMSTLGLFVNDDVTLMKWLWSYCFPGSGGRDSKRKKQE